MGKAKSGRKSDPSSSSKPYDRPSKSTKPSSAAAAASKNAVFKFNTNVGQHILKNPGIADAIVTKAFLKPTDTVLEIGPGTGNISVRILEKAKKLIAVELDPRMASEITKRVMGTPLQRKLDVLLGDAIKLDFPPHDVCISNTPYQISSPLVFKLLSMENPPRCCVLMFQREFALRLTARPGDPLYNRLSVNAQFFSKITHIMKVGKQNFRPPPQVESSVVRMEPKLGKDRPAVSWAEWDGLLRIVFSRKNKTIRASFGTKEVRSMLEKNFRTWCALNNVAVDDTALAEEDADEGGGAMDVDGDEGNKEEEEEWGGIMEVDDGDEGDNDDGGADDLPDFFQEQQGDAIAKTPSRQKKTRVAELVRSKIDKVLEMTELADKRAGKLEENDFLKLLYAFNRESIHFA